MLDISKARDILEKDVKGWSDEEIQKLLTSLYCLAGRYLDKHMKDVLSDSEKDYNENG
ncbi:hypothetical protein GF362_00095 [Candidatus Dojkabacteria bacterium]|nr:hypothetical protein [Candidatus Dojkabacteria bacterium]